MVSATSSSRRRRSSTRSCSPTRSPRRCPRSASRPRPPAPTRAGIHPHLTPHSMRHAFGDHIARYAGIKNAQALLGHADVGTTQVYTGAPTLDELAAAIKGIRFALEAEQTFYPLETHLARPLEAPTGIEPV